MVVRAHSYEERIRLAYDHLYANANIRTPERLAEEVAKILLALQHAEKTAEQGPLPSLTSSLAAAIKRANPDACDYVARQVRTQFASMNTELKRYPETTAVELDNASIAYVRLQLDALSFRGSEHDWLGDALEVFRTVSAKRLGGQFFTDQRVTELAVELLEYDPFDGDDFVDVCAGTGGFLLAAAKKGDGETGASGLRGLEADLSLVHVANASMSSLTDHRSDHVLPADSLADPSDWSPDVQRSVVPGAHQCLASNPPFGTKITVKDESLLQNYDLGHKWNKSRNGGWEKSSHGLSPRPLDVLFLERNLRLAEPGRGRVAVVTPYQVLSGPKLGFVREWLLRQARVRAVIDLPHETFQPWTGTKTALLVMERRAEPLSQWTADDDYPIYMARAEHIGHDRRGRPVYDAEGATYTDLPLIADDYKAYLANGEAGRSHQHAFSISSTEVTQGNDLRLNAAFYRPATYSVQAQVEGLGEGEEWTVRKLGDVTRRIFFPTRFKRHYVSPDEGGILFLGGTNISQLVPTNLKYLDPQTPRLQELLVEDGWLLVTRSGSTGVVSSVPPNWDGIAMSEHVIRIVPAPEELDPAYLQAYLRSELCQRMLAAGVFGSVIDEITPEYIAQIPIPVPKDEGLMRKVAGDIRIAEEGRQAAMESLETGVGLLEERLTFHA